MMQELVAKMSGQEQDWQKLLDKLLAEMDSKVRLGEDVGQVGLLLIPGPAMGGYCHSLQASLPPSICHLELTWCPSPSWTAWSWTH